MIVLDTIKQEIAHQRTQESNLAAHLERLTSEHAEVTKRLIATRGAIAMAEHILKRVQEESLPAANPVPDTNDNIEAIPGVEEDQAP